MKNPFRHRRFRFSLQVALAFVTVACVFAAVFAWWQREVPLVFRTLPEIQNSREFSGWSVHRLPDQPGPYAFYQMPYHSNAGLNGWVRLTYKGRTCRWDIVGIPDVEQLFVPLVTEEGKPTYVAFKKTVPAREANDSEE